MAADCPRCRRELNPFIAHLCGVPEPWSGPLSNTDTLSLSSQPSCCSPGGSCSSCRPAPTTGQIAPSTSETILRWASVSDFSGEKLLSPMGTLMALVMRPKAHPDSRGTVRETYRASWFPMVPPVKQLVQSNSKAKTLRGMHSHRSQWDIWRFVSDEALVRLYDPIASDETFIVGNKDVVIAIPPGVAHGFYTEDGCILVYALTNEYDGTDERGFYPFDGLTSTSHPGWPRHHYGLQISERDLRAPRLSEFEW